MKRIFSILFAVVLAVSLMLVPAASVGASPGPGLVGQWHLDEGSGKTAYDSSGASNDGTLSGGRFGGALSFDGVNDYVSVIDSISLSSIENGGTWELWIKPNSDLRQSKWIGFLDTAPGLVGAIQALVDPSNRLRACFGGVVGAMWSIDSDWTGEWHHIVGTWNRKVNPTVTLYVDGVQKAQATPTVTVKVDLLHIGSMNYCSFDGIIDEVRISNTVRYTADFTPSTTPFSPDAETVGLWHFDGNANDGSGNNNDGAVYGASWVPAGPTWTTGMFGNALSFDGMDDYVRVPGSDSLEAITSAITVEAWLKFDDVRDAFYVRTPFDKDPKAWGLDRWSGRLRFYIYDGGTPTICELSWSPTTDGWYHIAGTYDGTVLKLYVNGALLKSFDYSGAIDSTDMGVVIGARHSEGDWGFHRGIIDEVSIWDVALTPDEIAWLPPVTNVDFVLKDGSTLPLKFQVLDDSVSVTSPQWVSLAITGPEGFTKTYILGDGVENLRWNADGSYYIANLKTKDGDWPDGTYTATVEGIVTGTIDFDLAPSKGVGRGNSGK